MTNFGPLALTLYAFVGACGRIGYNEADDDFEPLPPSAAGQRQLCGRSL